MLKWFKERLVNRMPWFRYSTGANYVEGYKAKDHSLALSLRGESNWDIRTIVLDEKSVYKLRDWLNRSYPWKEDNVISLRKDQYPTGSIHLAEKLPLPGTSGNSETIPPDSGR